jgi:hypothetical protein
MRKLIVLANLVFVAIVLLVAQGEISTGGCCSLANVQSVRTYTCEVRKTADGWIIEPDIEYLTPMYWKVVCRADQVFDSKEEPIRILEAARWTMLPPTSNDFVRFQKKDNWSASPQAINRWEEFMQQNPEKQSDGE